MTYTVKSIFYSLQGEGFHAGRPAVFCRFSGCNLWTGLEKDRKKAVCKFCDTDFVGGQKYSTAKDVATAVNNAWAGDSTNKYVVLTGGEPLLQVNEELIEAFHQKDFTVAVESNGTQNVPNGIDWLAVSPKAGAPLTVEGGNELKLVYPQSENKPADFEHLNFEHFFLQPKAESGADNTRLTIDYCLLHPRWKLSLQTHKMIGIE